MSTLDNNTNLIYNQPFMEDGKFSIERDIDCCIQHLKDGKLLSEGTLKFICSKLIEISSLESNIRAINAPVTVVGDIHGYIINFIVLIKLF